MTAAVRSESRPSFAALLAKVKLPDTLLLVAALLLALLGLVMIASSSMDFAAQKYGDGFFHLRRHGFYLVLATILGCMAYQLPLAVWQRAAPFLLVCSFLVLILILIPGVGHTANNATRWLAVGPFTFQGSELAKIGVVLYLASYLVRQYELVRSHWSGFFNPMAMMMALVVLLLAEPDFGAVVVLLGAALGMLFLGGVKLWQFLLLIAGSLAAVAMMVMSSTYRMERLNAFLDPWKHQFGDGYQLTQALIAFGRGDVFGIGLGNSIQKLFYLPEAHTDFVFAILAEELGLFGCLVTLAVYALLIGRMFWVAVRAQALQLAFGAYIAYGIGLLFSAQLLINVGVNVGLLPTKGLTLPFLSYGGSSLLVSFILVALVLRVDRETREQVSTSLARRAGRRIDV